LFLLRVLLAFCTTVCLSLHIFESHLRRCRPEHPLPRLDLCASLNHTPIALCSGVWLRGCFGRCQRTTTPTTTTQVPATNATYIFFCVSISFPTPLTILGDGYAVFLPSLLFTFFFIQEKVWTITPLLPPQFLIPLGPPRLDILFFPVDCFSLFLRPSHPPIFSPCLVNQGAFGIPPHISHPF